MSGLRDPLDLDQAGHDLLAHALTLCGREEFTGELRVAGAPGGTLHLRHGLVVGAHSPGAPGPEALLLRSGRVSGEEWAALVRESGGARWPAARLIARGYAGAAQLKVMCVMALHDAVFAVLAGRVHGCERVAETEPFATIAVGEMSNRLLQEGTRRLAALSALPHPVHPERERPHPVPGRDAGPLSALQRELLTHADGRSTARDLAFRTGRGVYTVTVEMARMLGEGLLELAAAPTPIPVRPVPDGQGVRQRDPSPPTAPPLVPGTLPRRKPGGFFRLRNGAPQ